MNKWIMFLYAVIFSLCKAKNVGDAGHRRGFLTQQKGKKTSRKCKSIFSSFLMGVWWLSGMAEGVAVPEPRASLAVATLRSQSRAFTPASD